MTYNFELFDEVTGFSTGHLCDVKLLKKYHPQPENGECKKCHTTTKIINDKVEFTDIGPGFNGELRRVFKKLTLSIVGLDKKGRVNIVSQKFCKPLGPIGGHVITRYTAFAYEDENKKINFIETIEWREIKNSQSLVEISKKIKVAPIKLIQKKDKSFFTMDDLTLKSEKKSNEKYIKEKTKYTLSNKKIYTEWFWLQG